MKLGLVWFGNDLRCTDQKMLSLAAQEVDQLVCLYCDEPQHKQPSRYATQGMSALRRRFLDEGLNSLATELEKLGQTLFVSQHDVVTSITLLLNELPISHLYCNHNSGWNEQQSLEKIAHDFADVHFHIEHGLTLFEPEQLPFTFTSLVTTSTKKPEQEYGFPSCFSKFRKLVEVLDPPLSSPHVTQLPMVSELLLKLSLPLIRPWKPKPVTSIPTFAGGEKAARQQLNHYFSTNLASHYKEVRNALDGWGNSTKFSPWLAQGSLSPRQIKAALTQYEEKYGENESTYWIYFELLWREYFQWYATYYGKQLFLVGGLSNAKTHGSFYAERFRKWCEGNTPYPIVNACMKQLNQTGFMSNRGRQIVASCLVHELAIDWRYGAAYFEEKLIDYDVASNWGNWQYIAGVGADPRGGRRFNLEKQTEQYDPNHHFIHKWQGHHYDSQLDSVDAADWPISPQA
ncbi:DASH family cryptochrome [Marinomonas colpomeniae]|uniref:Cryptochrome DASH n=1 Tax=Marinomonas colpomeniae TaxID=2774408 RepID=A0ABR8NXL0_9GAMM|nr:DASH family cryptochrome [Marinomonas colpomeniae]MBD5770786.1 DASH family cryptochrome [Marinomonas colpomeniae]